MIDTLEIYRTLPENVKLHLKDMENLNAIFGCMKSENVVLSDDEIRKIAGFSKELWLKDESYNFELYTLAYYICKAYIEDNDFFNHVKDYSYHKILDALDNDNLHFYLDED